MDSKATFANSEILQLIINTISDGIIVIDKSGSFQLYNPAAKLIAGIESGSASLTDWSNNYGLFDPDTKKPFPVEKLPLLRAINGESTDDIEMFIQNKFIPAGAYISTTGRPLLDENNEIVGGMVVIRNNTIKREAQLSIRKSEEKYRILFQNSNDAIYITTLNGEILEVNQAFLTLFNYEKAELYGANARMLYVDPIDRNKFLHEIHTNQGLKNYLLVLKKKSGEAIDCSISSTLRYDFDGSIIGFQGIIRDISIYKRSATLKKEKELAEKSSRFKDRFLANMSHEIRTPLNGIIGMINLVNDTQLSAQQSNYVEGVKSSSEHLLELVNDILDFSKIEAGKIEFLHTPFSIKHTLNNSINTLELKSKAKGLDLIVNLHENVPQYVVGDPVKLNQILYNLVGNAIKFTNYGSITVNVKLIEERKKSVILRFNVIDTGIGIEADNVENIFGSFTQLMNDNNTKTTGTGLGLAITKQLIELQGGSIRVKSEFGSGSTFSFTIKYKIHTGSKKDVFHFSSSKPFETVDIGEKNILLVEDHRLNQEVAVNTIKNWWPKVNIDVAENGKVALEKILLKDYHLVLMDIQMPEMDGYQTTEIIRNELDSPLKDIPIMAMTAHASPTEAEKCLSHGMNDYLSKPFKPHDLHNKIIALLNFEQRSKSKVENEEKENSYTKDEVLNLDYLRSMTNNDAEMLLKMIELLEEDVPEELRLLNQEVMAENWNRVRAVSHKLKSSLNFLGLKHTRIECQVIEKDAEEVKNLENINQRVENVIKITNIALEELQIEKAALL